MHPHETVTVSDSMHRTTDTLHQNISRLPKLNLPYFSGDLSHQNQFPSKVVPPDRYLRKKWSPGPILAAKIGLPGLILAAKIGPP